MEHRIISERVRAMSRKNTAVIVVCMAVLFLWGCGKREGGQKQPAPAGPAQKQSSNNPVSQTPAESRPAAQPSAPAAPVGGAPSPAEMAQVAEQNRQALAQMNQGKQVAAVTADKLKALLPSSLTGMSRTTASAERTQTMGVDMTTAEAQYDTAGGGSVSVKITDVGNMTGSMRMGLAAWSVAEYNRETDTGYQKSMTYNGCKGMEEYDKQDQHGAIRVFVADRFIVEVEGNGVTVDTLKQALGSVDLKKMAGLVSGS
jgi:hypothetical protein